MDVDYGTAGYPHYYPLPELADEGWASIEVSGAQARDFVAFAAAGDPEALEPGGRQQTQVSGANGGVLASGWLERPGDSTERYRLHLDGNGGSALEWLRDLSDGYVATADGSHDTAPGPVVVNVADTPGWVTAETGE
jgi:hypothetical protein